MERKLVCIICPRGCRLSVSGEADSLSVSGNSCKRGEIYAKEECTNPVRTLTSFVRVANRKNTMVSVKTSAPIPKDKLFEAMEVIRELKVDAPVNTGDVIKENIYSAQLVATKSIK